MGGTAGLSPDRWGTPVPLEHRRPFPVAVGPPSASHLPSLSCFLSLLICPSVCLLSEWGWTYNSGTIQRKSRRTVGLRSSCRIEGWAPPVVGPSCRLIWSSCLDRRGSGLGFPWGPLPSFPTQGAPDVLGSRVRVGAGRALVGYHRRSWGSHLHTQLGTLFLLPIDLGHSLQGLQGEFQPSQGGVPEGRLNEEPIGGVWGWA